MHRPDDKNVLKAYLNIFQKQTDLTPTGASEYTWLNTDSEYAYSGKEGRNTTVVVNALNSILKVSITISRWMLTSFSQV